MENSKGVQKRWLVGQRDAAAEARLSAELGISSLVSAILVSRGITDPATAHTFLNPSLSDLHNPELLPDYTAARDQILGARERKETPKVAWQKADTIRVVEGPFSEFTGKIEEVNTEKEKLKVLINIFGRDTPVELDFNQVEKL